MRISIEEIQNKFEKLPEDLKWAIMGAKIDEKLMQIGADQGLNIGQIGQLSLETHAVMLGYTHPDQFSSSIKESLGLTDEKIKLITKSVNERILKGVREKLVELRGGVIPKEEVVEKILPKEKLEESLKPIERETIDRNNITSTEAESNKIELSDVPTEALIEDKKITNSVITKKLVNTVSSNTVKTDHSLENNNQVKNTELSKEPKKIDPYRMPIED